ncbi:DNA-3-methyladenine glycosylase 2 [Zhihengliuella alba]|uniref:DNA-3-methyladenine glycosylase 2 n=1 Tax=Zhihengliuella alba TaxID=547018 RepID=UPI0031EA4490
MRVEANGLFDAGTSARVLAAHDVPGVSSTDVAGRLHRRWVRAAGRDVQVELTLVEDAGIDVLVQRTGGSLGRAAPEEGLPPTSADAGSGGETQRDLERLVARWFGLEDDLGPARTALAADPVLAPLLAERPGLRVTGCVDEFEAVVTAVLGQQVSLAACRTFAGRFVAAARPDPASGAPGDSPGAGRGRDSGEGLGLVPFPGPERYAGLEAAELQQAVGITGARARTLAGVVAAWSEGFRLDALPPGEARAALLALPGIGPWTAEYLAVRLLGDADTFISGDLVARRALAGALGAGPLTPRQAAAHAARWSPWRTYALLHLWASEAYAVPEESTR